MAVPSDDPGAVVTVDEAGHGLAQLVGGVVQGGPQVLVLEAADPALSAAMVPAHQERGAVGDPEPDQRAGEVGRVMQEVEMDLAVQLDRLRGRCPLPRIVMGVEPRPAEASSSKSNGTGARGDARGQGMPVQVTLEDRHADRPVSTQTSWRPAAASSARSPPHVRSPCLARARMGTGAHAPTSTSSSPYPNGWPRWRRVQGDRRRSGSRAMLAAATKARAAVE